MTRYLPSALLLVVAAILYGRAGYGPFGDRKHRGRPCTDATRYPHNASILAGLAILMLGAKARHARHGQDKAIAS